MDNKPDPFDAHFPDEFGPRAAHRGRREWFVLAVGLAACSLVALAGRPRPTSPPPTVGPMLPAIPAEWLVADTFDLPGAASPTFPIPLADPVPSAIPIPLTFPHPRAIPIPLTPDPGPR